VFKSGPPAPTHLSVKHALTFCRLKLFIIFT
jgi:hypothetical protein